MYSTLTATAASSSWQTSRFHVSIKFNIFLELQFENYLIKFYFIELLIIEYLNLNLLPLSWFTLY